MGCVIEFSEPFVRFDFCSRHNKQKVLIDALLKYGKLGIPGLARVLDVPTQVLEAVHGGTGFFDEEQADNLSRLFLICFGD